MITVSVLKRSNTFSDKRFVSYARLCGCMLLYWWVCSMSSFTLYSGLSSPVTWCPADKLPAGCVPGCLNLWLISSYVLFFSLFNTGASLICITSAELTNLACASIFDPRLKYLDDRWYREQSSDLTQVYATYPLTTPINTQISLCMFFILMCYIKHSTTYSKIVVAFRGMHLLPAKQLCVTTKKVWLPDRQTDTRTEGCLTMWS